MASPTVETPEREPLAAYGAEVLALLESTPEWDSGTMDEVGLMAIRHGIAHTDRHGMFTRGPAPDTAA